MLGEKKHHHRELEKTIGYTFKDLKLLREALTHSSVRSGKEHPRDNERLEFIGDRVLGLIVSEYLIETYPVAREGELARRYNRLVCKDTCAGVGKQINLGRYLILAPSEEDSGGREKITIIADAVEALLAALFLEIGYENAKNIVLKLWKDHFSHEGFSAASDSKTALQEWAQARKLPLPEYVQINRAGPDHAPQFTTEVRLQGYCSGFGKGCSKRASERAAASDLLRIVKKEKSVLNAPP